jgi:hypothetical protein
MCRTPILVRESAFFLGERPRKNRFLRYDGNLIAKTLRSRGGRASVATAALDEVPTVGHHAGSG